MRLFQALLLSIAVHFLLVFIAEKTAPYFETPKKDVTEVELVEPKSPPPPRQQQKPKQQMVRQALAPEKLLRPDDDTLARFLSAERQRVRQETQAQNSGMTQNRSASATQQRTPPKPQQQQQQPPNRQAVKRDYDPNGIDIAKNLNEYRQMQSQNAPSTVGEALPQDVKIGSFTALNTDRFTYYSFFARVEELIRFRWESRVRDHIDSHDRNYIMSVLANHNWVTEVDIWLTRDGRFHSSHIMHESGVPKFDEAAVNAFKDAAMFPNPPQEMVESDGYIHLQYGFDVNLNPSALVSQ